MKCGNAKKGVAMKCLFYIVMIWLASVGSGFGQNSSNAAAEPAISLKIKEFARSSTKPFRLSIQVTLTNISSRDVTIIREIRGRDICLDVRKDGHLAPETRFGMIAHGSAEANRIEPSPSERTGALIDTTISPGKDLSWVVDVTSFYDLGNPGIYSIVAQEPDPENSSLVVKSNMIKITVPPR
jgi:hypothetical protein